jgi:pilus assembly protein Flp/PilA
VGAAIAGTNGTLGRTVCLFDTRGSPRFEGSRAHPGGCRTALVHSLLGALRRDEEGQGLAEYALILALIAIVAIIALIFLGGQVSSILSQVGASI